MKAYSSFTLSLLSIALTYVPARQIDTERISPEQDMGDLYLRAAASRFVVIGTIAKTDGVSQRMTPELLQRVKAESDLSLTLGGGLYTIRIESTVCRQTDFEVDAYTSMEAAHTAYMFLPRDEPLFVNGHRRETLLAGQRYLLFLAAVPPRVQQKWVELFQLDPKEHYYRGEELSRGVVPLFRQTAEGFTPMQPPVLGKIVQLCQAVRPPHLAEKLEALKTLASSGDSVLQREAEIAVNALRSQGMRSPK